MKQYRILNFFVLIALSIGFVSCSDFLDRPPIDKLENSKDFYNSEGNIRSTLIALYENFFVGYNKGWSRSDFFDGTARAERCDDFVQETATFFVKNAPTTGGGWGFNNVKRTNIVLEGLESSTLQDEAKNHWIGVAKFFRALAYSSLVRTFGDVPYLDKVPLPTDYELLYQPRQKRIVVMDHVLEDLKFASEHVRESDGVAGVTVNKYVVDAFISRIMLFEGTWQKYFEKNNAKAEEYLKVAKDAANRVIESGKYKICKDYRSLTTSIDLSGNPEVLIYRSYVEGELTHSTMSFQSEQTLGNSPSKDIIDSYLTKNGLPIHQVGNSDFLGDKNFEAEFTNRDPRLLMTTDLTHLHLNGITSAVYAIGGYFNTRFINFSLLNTPGGQSSTNITDAPIMKLNEVMLNYIEAAAELADMGKYTLTQEDFDKTINEIRSREDVKMPALTLNGDRLSVNGVEINDPDRDKGYAEVEGDYEVSPILWEIRRERRTELSFEGLRFDDLRRWKKLHYADMTLNKKVNMGSWLDKEEYLAIFNAKFNQHYKLDDLNGVYLDREGNAGYIRPISEIAKMRKYEEKHYLFPIPLNQIALYKSKSEELGDPSIVLTQNPGW